MTWRTLLRILCPVVALTTAVACGQPSEEDRRRDLAEDLVRETDGRLDGVTARCVADGLFDAFGDDGLDAVVAVADGAEDDARIRVRVVDVFNDCDAIGTIATGGGGADDETDDAG